MTENAEIFSNSMRTILNSKGEVRGRLDEGNNTMLAVYNRQGRCLGYYHQVQDKTYTAGGGYVGPGDQRMVLLEE
jgi:hypothetical protein